MPEGTTRPPALQFTLLYEQLGFDQLGKPIFFGSFNNIQATLGFPFNALLLVSNQWTNGFGHHRQRTRITSPTEQVLVESDDVEFFLKDSLSSQRVDHRLGVTFAEDGRHKISVLLNDKVVLEYFFTVRVQKARPTASQE